jgi:hypothetical protein
MFLFWYYTLYNIEWPHNILIAFHLYHSQSMESELDLFVTQTTVAIEAPRARSDLPYTLSITVSRNWLTSYVLGGSVNATIDLSESKALSWYSLKTSGFRPGAREVVWLLLVLYIGANVTVYYTSGSFGSGCGPGGICIWWVWRTAARW